MKFDPSHKLISGFSYISFATMLLLVFTFVFISVEIKQKPAEENSIVKSNTEVAKANPATQKVQDEQPKTETVVKQEISEPPVNENSIVKKVDEKNSGVEFELDFGGRAIRKIKSYLVPEYDGIEKGGGSPKLNFTIKPDGSVSKIFPVNKSNSRQELQSIFAMRQWRFEPLKKSADQVDQPAVITFLYH